MVCDLCKRCAYLVVSDKDKIDEKGRRLPDDFIEGSCRYYSSIPNDDVKYRGFYPKCDITKCGGPYKEDSPNIKIVIS